MLRGLFVSNPITKPIRLKMFVRLRSFLPLLIVGWASCVHPLSALGQAASTTAQSDVEPELQRATTGGSQDRPTAEALLRALRRGRPVSDVIPPVGAKPDAKDGDRHLLLPEGASVVDRAGRLGKTGDWWTFIPDPPTGEPPIKLLPNLNLELMVRTAGEGEASIPFSVSGEVTVFRDENYLLVRLAKRSIVVEPEPEPAPVETPSPEGQPAEGDSAEDVLTKLHKKKPSQKAIFDIAGRRQGRGQPTLAARALPDSTPLVRRPGRLIHDGKWWKFAFESDHPDYPEPPMRLLPNQSLEQMLAASDRGRHALVFVVSGEVTLFEGQNCLLPRVALRRIASGNTSK